MTVQQKETIHRMRGDGFGYKEIAKILGLSVNTVKSYGRRCVQMIEQEALPEGMCRCAGCGAVYAQPPKRKAKRFCSDTCRLSWWHRNKTLSRTAIAVACPGCGRSIMVQCNQKHCSHSCYIKARFGGERHEQAAN